MSDLSKILLLVLIVAIVVMGSSFALSMNSSNKLLHKIRLLEPRRDLKEVEDRLGPKLYETDDLDFMIKLGPLKDRSFCQGKKLFWFYSSAPPARALAVYTDENNLISFVTWQNL